LRRYSPEYSYTLALIITNQAFELKGKRNAVILEKLPNSAIWSLNSDSPLKLNTIDSMDIILTWRNFGKYVFIVA